MGVTGLHNRAVVRSRLHLEFLLDFMSLGQMHIRELRRHCQTVIRRHEDPPLGHQQRAYNRTEPRGTKRSLPDLNLPIVLGSGAPQQEAPLLHLPFEAPNKVFECPILTNKALIRSGVDEREES